MNHNPEVSVAGLAAQATAQNNRTFANLHINTLAMYVVRKVVGTNKHRAREQAALRLEEASKHKLSNRQAKVLKKLTKARAEFAFRLVEWDVEPHHTQAFINKHKGKQTNYKNLKKLWIENRMIKLKGSKRKKKNSRTICAGKTRKSNVLWRLNIIK